MSNGFETLVTSLERRYDYQSARIIAREALATAGLKEADKYSAADLQKFVDGLAKVGTDLADVYEALGVTPTGTAAPAAKAAEKEEAKPEAKAAEKKDEAKADKKEEAKPEAKAAEKKDEAKADKKDEGDEAKKDEAKKPAAKKAPAKKK